MRILCYPDLKPQKGVPYSRSQLWRKIRNGSFPAPLKLGAGRIGWLETDIDRWIKKLVEERDALQAKKI